MLLYLLTGLSIFKQPDHNVSWCAFGNHCRIYINIIIIILSIFLPDSLVSTDKYVRFHDFRIMNVNAETNQ